MPSYSSADLLLAVALLGEWPSLLDLTESMPPRSSQLRAVCVYYIRLTEGPPALPSLPAAAGALCGYAAADET